MSYYVNPHGHSCPWYPFAELFGAPNIKWCEETLCHWVSEPANTWSNVLYMIMAFYIFWSSSKTKQFEHLWMGPAMFLMGLFSLIYHMSNNYLTQVLDFIGMFIFVFWLIVLNFRRLNWITAKNQIPFWVILTSLSTIALHLMYINFIKIQLIIAVSVLTIIGTEFLCYIKRERPINYTFYSVALILMVLAQTASLLDAARVSWICDPTNHWFQGHALWHVIGAVGLTFAYKHYEQFKFSETKNDDDDYNDQLEFIIDDDIETQLEV